MNASEIVQAITLAVAGWTLLEVIAQGKSVAALKQKIRDLPCQNCGAVKIKHAENHE